MTEDSGAFKTNPPNSSPIPVIVASPPAVAAKPQPVKEVFPVHGRALAHPICNKRSGYLAVFSNQPDSLRTEISDAARTRPVQ
jgi:hypothetical protein